MIAQNTADSASGLSEAKSLVTDYYCLLWDCIKGDSFHPSLSTTLLCSSYLLLAAQETIPQNSALNNGLKQQSFIFLINLQFG